MNNAENEVLQIKIEGKETDSAAIKQFELFPRKKQPKMQYQEKKEDQKEHGKDHECECTFQTLILT
jgi:hypothetical protein